MENSMEMKSTAISEREGTAKQDVIGKRKYIKKKLRKYNKIFDN